MMNERALKNQVWDLKPSSGGGYSWEAIHTGLLMDIRDELQRLNRLLHCPNFMSMPYVLQDIKKNTTKRRRKKK